MKKLLCMAITFVMVFAAIACTAQPAPAPAPAPEKVEAPVVEEKAPAAETQPAPAPEATVEEAAPVEEASAAAAVKVLGLNLKNKTGNEIAEAYFYVTGGEKGAPIVTAWADKDADEANYEKFVYIVREAAESYTMEVVYADGTNAALDLGAVECYDKISLKGAATEDWKHEANDDEADKAAIDEVIAAGKTADGCYPGYKAVGLEVKNKTGNDVTEFYIVPAGADKAAAKNIVAEVVNFDGAKLDGAWTSGKGGFYIYGFILVPEDTTAVDVYLVYADGSTCEALGYADLFAVDGDGNLPNELSMKDAADPDLWKAAFDDGEEVKPNIDAAIAAGIPMDGTYPVY